MEQERVVQAENLQRQLRILERRAFSLSLSTLLGTLLLGVGIGGLMLPRLAQRLMPPQLLAHYLTPSLLGLVALLVLLELIALRQRRALRQVADLVDEVVRRDTAEKLSLVDPVTGTFNRRYLDEIIPRETSRADRRESSLSFVKLSLDDFSSLDARLGYQAGDRILQEVAQLLKRSFRPTDIIVRYAGDEFLVVLPETGPQGALAAAQRLLSRVDEWNRRKPIRDYKMQLSIGVGGYTKGADIRDVLAATDHRVELYRERKEAGD